MRQPQPQSMSIWIAMGILCFAISACDTFGVMLPLDEPETVLLESTPYMIERDVFCEDERPPQIIEALRDVVRNQDGEAFARLVSPNGLYMSLNSGTTIHLSVDEVRDFFDDEVVRNWGSNGYNPIEVEASLAGSITDFLVDDLLPDNITIACNNNQDDLSEQTVLYNILIPDQSIDYINNFYSVMRPGEVGWEHNWGAWGLAFEYRDGAPLIFAMTHYRWTT